jgi:hypothetical protein
MGHLKMSMLQRLKVGAVDEAIALSEQLRISRGDVVKSTNLSWFDVMEERVGVENSWRYFSACVTRL